MPTLGLSMIVRDAAADLEPCLASVADAVDEILVADTGSRDGTPELARRLGARVVAITWERDFAGARNQALAAMTSDWVLTLDADERLECGPPLRGLTRGPADAYQVTIRNYVRSMQARVWDRMAEANDRAWPEASRYPGFITHQNVRLFRRVPELHFVGCVHESVGPSVRAAGLRLGQAAENQIRIHHFGLAAEPDVVEAKNHFYRELARRKVAEQPQDAQAHFELGLMEFDNFHENAVALQCFERALRLRPGFGLAWLFGGATLMRLGHAADALAFFTQARHAGCASPQLAELTGDALYAMGRFGEAAAAYHRGSTESGAHGGLESKRGLAEVRAGHTHAGLRHLRRARAAQPEIAANHDRLVQALVWLDDLPAALASQQERVRHFPGEEAARQRLHAMQGQLDLVTESV